MASSYVTNNGTSFLFTSTYLGQEAKIEVTYVNAISKSFIYKDKKVTLHSGKYTSKFVLEFNDHC